MHHTTTRLSHLLYPGEDSEHFDFQRRMHAEVLKKQSTIFEDFTIMLDTVIGTYIFLASGDLRAGFTGADILALDMLSITKMSGNLTNH